MASLKGFFISYLSSGKNIQSDGSLVFNDDLIRHILLNGTLSLGAGALLGFGVSVGLSGNVFRAMTDFVTAGICIITILVLRSKFPFLVGGILSIGAIGILFSQFVFTGELRGFASLWVFSYPLVSIFVLGLAIGLSMSILLLAAMLVATLIPGMSSGLAYTPVMASRLCGVYILVVVLTVLYEVTRIIKEQRVNRLTTELQTERDEITAMKDNLKTGVFLLDQDYAIQPAYSKSLETVLGIEELQGVLFTDLLSTSLKEKEREIMLDYFNMVINRSYDTKMLEEINPISTFVFINDNFETEKNLRTSFAPIYRGSGDTYILGTVEDITAEVELQQQLAEEASKRDEEMRSLFQVIKVEPRVFMDFIEDAENEFERINDIMKDRAISALDAMIMVYQAVHAIKSNALILGLENFSGKLHELESEIKRVQAKEEDITFEDVLHITVELEIIMREKDKYRETIDKLQSFKGGDSRRQDRYVLIETLTQACEKAAIAMEKSVQFIVEDLDGVILENGPRRVIKEVLTQLVRNAVYHGIESPEEREALGKEREGHVRLSIKYNGGRIHMRLTDDGKGLDFNKIREKADALNLIPKEDLNDKNQLLQTIFAPGFSTADSEDEHAGRGIGLNLVRDRIRDLNGTIKLQTELGKGTSFNIYIPFDEALTIVKAS